VGWRRWPEPGFVRFIGFFGFDLQVVTQNPKNLINLFNPGSDKNLVA
jgi:hypothetical protein